MIQLEFGIWIIIWQQTLCTGMNEPRAFTYWKFKKFGDLTNRMICVIYLFIWRRNIYSEELLKIIHIDQDLEYIKDVDAMSKMDTDQKESTNTVYDQRNGVRCIR